MKKTLKRRNCCGRGSDGKRRGWKAFFANEVWTEEWMDNGWKIGMVGKRWIMDGWSPKLDSEMDNE